jgi:hypothetical protein
MPVYSPCDLITLFLTIAYIRQNCNKKNDDPLGSVQRTNAIHVPWAHTEQDTIEYQQDPQAFLEKTKYARICVELPIGSLILIPSGKKGLIVRLTSDVKSGIMNSYCTAVTPRTCGHKYVCGKHRCAQCGDSVQEVFDPSDAQKLSEHLKKGHLIEPFYSLYRDIEIVGEADYNGVDGRSMAGLDSAGKWQRYWAPRE